MDIEYGLDFRCIGGVNVTYKEAGQQKTLKANVKRLEKQLKEAEDKLSGYVFIDKKPDYFYSFSGFLIFRKWYVNNGLTASMAELLIIISYIDIFLTDHFKLYTRNHTRVPVRVVLEELIKQRYVIKIKVYGKSKSRLRNGWVLTQRGKDLETDYERFYDESMAAIKKGELYTFNFDDGSYFRKVRLSKFNRRLLQGGGTLPLSGRSDVHAFVEREVLNKRYEET